MYPNLEDAYGRSSRSINEHLAVTIYMVCILLIAAWVGAVPAPFLPTIRSLFLNMTSIRR